MELVIVNTGCANISSVRFAIERLGYQVAVSDNAAQIQAADKVFLPGVGSANAAMSQIKQKGLVEVVAKLTQPTLGICLGMQLMTKFSDEGNTDCLGVIPTKVNKMLADGLRLPHMGWNQITPVNNNSLFEGIAAGSYFYFVHGFAAPVSEVTLASCEYGQPFSASIGQGNYYGVQFHPERSSEAGARLLANFIQNT
ncbi:imidazole glycerol phosphate synthase subunit HisH [Neptunicella marina]|uniref:Imidazole glycerol phosphate synthase subunit HisH n=1 Tax=Neptunicella marina TaxID=2125989 RepID=A0A8J6IQG9_9ALTE|nr:imidazole glycerol phosphate synthase subunit HisH [Neptunicella marina]MBC3764689.1 imidazole glycerol phosphate synthase subunit HisH [Neptunicella marina]